MFGHDWPLEGRVLAERPKPGWAKRHRGLELAAPRQFVIEYDLAGKTQRVELEVKADKIVALSVGDKVPLLVDRKSARVKFDLRDPQLNRILAREAREGADKDEFDALLEGGLSEPADDEAKLQELLDDGILTPAEFFAQLQRIRDSQ